MSRLNAYAPYFLAILRIMAALLFIAHGTSKLFGWPSAGMQPPLMSLFGLAAIIELVGGVLLVLGLFTRIVAFILSGQMAFAYWMAHAPKSIYPALNSGDAAILYCFIFLYLVFAGAGAFAIDKGSRG